MSSQPWISYQLLVLCLRVAVMAQMKTFTLYGSHCKSRKGNLLFITVDTDGKWEYPGLQHLTCLVLYY